MDFLFFYRRGTRSRQKTNKIKGHSIVDDQTRALATATEHGNAAEIKQALNLWINARQLNTKENSLNDVNWPTNFVELEELQELLNAALYLTPPKRLNRPRAQVLVDRLLKLEESEKKTDRNGALASLFSH